MSVRNSTQNFARACVIAASMSLGGCAVYTPGPGPGSVYVSPGPVYVEPVPYYGPYYGHAYAHHYRRY